VALFTSNKDETVTTDDDGTVVTTTDERVREDRLVGRAQVDEREAARRRLAAPLPARTETVAAAPVSAVTESTEVIDVRRPRASMLASLSLMLGVVGAVALLTGLLAGPAVAVGAIAALIGFGGVSATTRRHIAGKGDALLGIVLGLGTVVAGALALTGTLPMFDSGINYVADARDWLQAQLPWLFPV
jgi:hypothetical protein